MLKCSEVFKGAWVLLKGKLLSLHQKEVNIFHLVLLLSDLNKVSQFLISIEIGFDR